ncbi:unnamed protein product [Bemisia tabaci]|uniref:Poly [ADP-ribose] polymerase n=1 Tax=Bemisia tabaci TaxID=7038 RepID=A0A9P0F5K3_BEMTA|nr:unnamed protein product [Bemisia tabaci]
MADDLPFRAEYSKSNRAACKGCKEKIDKDVLRMAVMVRSPFFDGKQPNWFHFMCFFAKQRPKSVGDIAHFDSLRWDDQEKIRKRVDSAAGTSAPATNGKSATKRSKTATTLTTPDMKDFTIQYSVSSRATCIGCQTQIAKDEVRVAKKDYESEEALRFGGLDRWHHLECFAKLRGEAKWYDCGSKLPGFKALNTDDQKKVKQLIPKLKIKAEVKDEVDAEVPAKKIKEDPEVKGNLEAMKKQNKLIFAYRDNLKSLTKKELTALLEHNEQGIPEGTERILDRLSDCMSFGALLPCEHCKTGQLVFRSNVGYQCIGHLNEWAKCQKVVMKPKRVKFTVPEDLKEKYSFLGNYKCKLGERLFEVRESSAAVAVKTENGPKVDRWAPLKNMTFLLVGKFSKPLSEIKKDIVKLGGHVATSVVDELAAVIASPAEVEKMSSKMMDAQSQGIQVVPESFLEEAAKGNAVEKILTLNIASWGQDPKVRIEKQAKMNVMKSQMSGKSKFLSSGPSKVKLTMKAGIVVDPDSGLEDVAHVYTRHGTAYTCVLGLTDITQDKNSYYKLQILEADKSKRYWLFRSWGRIGTTIGGNKLEDFRSVDNAISQFHELYEKQTGNLWENRKHFVKIPGKFYPIDVDYGEEEAKLSSDSTVPCKLHKAVQNLISLLFDVNNMKKIMMEFELDLEKMPLGKLSRKQITEAYSSLKVIQNLLQTRTEADRKVHEIISETNKFYTLIPHNFGVDKIQPINDEVLLKQKIDMLDSLMEIELAYNMLKTTNDENNSNVHPLEQHYAKLHSDIDVLNKETDEFKMIKKYVKNTHAATHNLYKLEIDEVFKVRRHGEDDRYSKYKNLHNRKLLWHGSRLTNFAGILSQGLRIAPPEAPTTGYMFGKGIYFADMVSKSANYCMPSQINCNGLLLLCQVALGDTYENKQAKYIEKLPDGKHSCMGVGQTEPDPAKTYRREDGVEVPLGKGVPSKVKNSALLYNEFIVYDVAQVKVEYLVKMKFKFD